MGHVATRASSFLPPGACALHSTVGVFHSTVACRIRWQLQSGTLCEDMGKFGAPVRHLAK